MRPRWVQAVALGAALVVAAACATADQEEADTATKFKPSAGSSGSGGSGQLPDGGSFPDGSAFPDGGGGSGTAGSGTAGTGTAGSGTAGTGTAGTGTAGTGTAGTGTAGTGTAGSSTGPCAGKPDGTVCATTTDPCKSAGVCQGGLCGNPTSKADGTTCGTTNDPCKKDAVCQGGVCGGFQNEPDGTSCGSASSACVGASTCQAGTCKAGAAKPQGFNWDPGDPWARCCGGQAIHTTSDSNCGGCGIVCNAANGESCETRSNLGHTQYYCAGCVASAKCWSGCCSLSNPATKNVCSASDCAGNCGDKCPSGMHCVSGAAYQMSNWCEY